MGLLVVKSMEMGVVALIDTSQCTAQLFIQSKSLFIFAAHNEISLLTMWNTDESSANMNTSHVSPSGKSFI